MPSIPPPPPSPSHGPLSSRQQQQKLITTLGLNLTPMQTLLFAMSVGASAKHIFWILATSKEKMSASSAAVVAAFNFLINALNVLAFGLAAVNPTYYRSAPWNVYVGVALFVVGILVEPIAEVQRRNFKDDPRNEGKPYSGGLFALARSVNYGAYTTWRTGFALAAGGPVWAALVAAFFLRDFASRAVPTMEEYCSKRYGAQWEEVKRKVPYKLIPWVY
ncbi:hypothetical protein GJ744_004757 [Endocarpon pusillum]|uniref:Steroid 5-alpha reductase C-terminal domain-containing protein n=1 Tax=Endocarpon pusillum TaxID=364733 RepID=A0A8H7ACY4_9EURO|nr:hypothetical protein GJ744_004757 [Endocarpon pusillum]